MVIYAEDRSEVTQFELGELFQKGQFGSRDYKQAFNWYLKAAMKGSRRAQHRVGSMYARGQGVRQSYAKAYAWCMVAATQDSKYAKRKLKIITQKMRFDQIRRGRMLAKKFYRLYVAEQE